MSDNKESVLDVLAAATNGHCGPLQMLRAHDLVAELIAAADAYKNEASCPDMVQFSQDRKIYDDAERRLVAALAACKG